MSNKEKSPLWGIVMTVVFALTAVITLYNLFSFIGKDYYWSLANQFNLPTVEPNYVFGNRNPYGEIVFTIEQLPHIIKDWIFGISLLCFLAFCILAIIKKEQKNKAVSISLIAFAALQLIAYALQIILIVVDFNKSAIPLHQWEYNLYRIGFSPSYLWECLWRMLVCVILLLYALKNFVPAIDNLLSSISKQTIFNVCTVIFLLSFAFLPSTSLYNVSSYHESDFSIHLPFLVATLWSWCQTAIFVWFIKE